MITPWTTWSAISSMAVMTTTNSPQHQKQSHDGSCCTANHDEIAKAAFCIYEKHGSQDGHDVRNWLDAETHVKAKHASSVHGAPPAAKAANASVR